MRSAHPSASRPPPPSGAAPFSHVHAQTQLISGAAAWFRPSSRPSSNPRPAVVMLPAPLLGRCWLLLALSFCMYHHPRVPLAVAADERDHHPAVPALPTLHVHTTRKVVIRARRHFLNERLLLRVGRAFLAGYRFKAVFISWGWGACSFSFHFFP